MDFRSFFRCLGANVLSVVLHACSNHEQTLSRIEAAFMDIEDQKADVYEMGKIAKVM